MSSPAQIVSRLREASKAYYETDKPIMTDTEYDRLVEELQKLDPTNPYLNEVGYKPTGAASIVKLPVAMASLDKKKPDTLRIDNQGHGWVVSDKLDGISALWICGYTKKPQLLLRGNGLEGQDVSHCIKGIQGLKQSSIPSAIIRGELIAPKGVIQGTLARNWVNGQLHKLAPSAEDLSKIRFVAYQVCEPRTLTRSQQVTWLLGQGFEVAWNKVLNALDVETLSKLFKQRRDESEYECDGIVVGQDVVPIIPSNASNPKDAFAFKMPLDDQKATTIVKEVEWASSRTGNWIPRLRFEPIQIGTATIEYCTGFHGQYIKENSIGPGAQIVVRRSGDVIPVVDQVLSGSPQGWQEPPKDRWTWDATGTHCVDTSTEETPEKLALEMAHQLVCLGVEGISKVTAKKLVEAGLKDLLSIKGASVEQLQKAIGKANGLKLAEGLKACMEKATGAQWIRAYLGWPKGFGESRIEAVLALEPNVAGWPLLQGPPRGQSAESFREIQKAVPGYLQWRAGFPSAPAASVSVETKTPEKGPVKGYYVLTGFRDAALQKRLQEEGWVLQDRITKQTTMLLVPNDAKETTKLKAARDAGIRIVTRGNIN
jgi:NAD-dependent DNA ligase